MLLTKLDVSAIFALIGIAVVSAICFQICCNLYWHPLAKFPGPWYTRASSLPLAILSTLRLEQKWLLQLMKNYGNQSAIRVSPGMIFFPKPSALREIYWDPKCDEKSPNIYQHGLLGPTHLFTTLSSAEHKPLRKALGAGPWTIGALKHDWEPRIDDLIRLFIEKMKDQARANNDVVLCNKVAEFAADVMTMFTFNEPWGFIKNGRDEKGLLKNWRQGLHFMGFVQRFPFFRTHIMTLPGMNALLTPTPSNKSGMGYLVMEANRNVTKRELELSQGLYPEQPDFLQHCLDARIDDVPLTDRQKRGHVTLLIQAGADTTGSALGSTLRFLATIPNALATAQQEISLAESENLLSTPIKYQETRDHLPFIIAAIKESLRLEPPAPNWFSRIVPAEGKIIDGLYLPPGINITSNAYVVQRDPEFYAPDPHAFRPERWLVEGKAAEYDAKQFVFGLGNRVCLGKDIATMELYKLIPEFIRRFDIELVKPGEWFVAGGIAYNGDFVVKLHARE